MLRAANEHPLATAIVDSSGPVSYAVFAEQAAAFCSLVSSHDEALPRVSLLFRRRDSSVYAAMFGCLMAGGNYSPINLNWPFQRIRDALSIFGPTTVVTDDLLTVRSILDSEASLADVPVVDALGIDTVAVSTKCIGSDWKLGSYRDGQEAYTIFTSGTTGKPKGVVISRGALNQFVESASRLTTPCIGDRWAQYSDVSFDLSVIDIYATLCNGATLYPVGFGFERVVPAQFIQKNAITIWVSVPSAVDIMVAKRDRLVDQLESVRLFVFCGEPLRVHQVQSIFDANPKATILNTYGPTENTVFCSVQMLTAKNWRTASDGNSIALGQPLQDTYFKLDPTKSSPYSELILSGKQLSSGYLCEFDVTNSPFVTIDGVPWYRTGDLVEQVGANIFFRGRIDTQVKIKGYRIELEEVSGAVSRITKTLSCAFIYENAILVIVEGRECNFSTLRSMLSNVLPHYMLPERFLLVERLPRTHNGKVDVLKCQLLISEGNLGE